MFKQNETAVGYNMLLVSEDPFPLKVLGPISQNENFYSNDASSPKKSWFQISFKSVKPF